MGTMKNKGVKKMRGKEKIEVFGTWIFVEDKDVGIMAYIFYPFYAETAIKAFMEDYHIDKMGVVTLVEDVFQI